MAAVPPVSLLGQPGVLIRQGESALLPFQAQLEKARQA
jgi:hypothetical protein